MIVYTLGTNLFPFNRAVSWLQELAEKEVINEPVLLQHGSTSVQRLNHPFINCKPSLSRNEMYEAVNKASLVISHAGQGSTRMLADMQAPFVLLPRFKCYGEHVDDHQFMFAHTVEKFGIPYCTKLEQLVQHIRNPPLPFQGKLLNAPSLAEYFINQYSC